MSSEYIKQLEDANRSLQRKLEDALLKNEENLIREKCLKLRPKRMFSLNGYKDIHNASEYAQYMNKPYPENARYPDYMYWTFFESATERDGDFNSHFKYQMRLYMGIVPKVNTNCRELWLDDKIMDMSILVFNWYRALTPGGVFRDRLFLDACGLYQKRACRRYIIEKGNPVIQYFRGKGRIPAFTTAMTVKP